MNETDWKDRISINPNVCHGRPCVKGTRIWVALVLDLLASGGTVEDILEEYPQLVREDIQACIAYGAETTRERFISITLEGRNDIQTG
jgi:uncharacterized protein (DUF433 family)